MATSSASDYVYQPGYSVNTQSENCNELTFATAPVEQRASQELMNRYRGLSRSRLWHLCDSACMALAKGTRLHCGGGTHLTQPMTAVGRERQAINANTGRSRDSLSEA